MLCAAVLFGSACATGAPIGMVGRGRGDGASATIRTSDALRARESAEAARDRATDAEAERGAKALFDEALDLLIAGYDALDAGDEDAAASCFGQAADAFEASRRASSQAARQESL